MTGSGKTAAFLLPILQRLQKAGAGRTRALILTPTRELAAQVGSHLDGLATHTGVSGAVIHGGVPMGPQETALRRGVQVIVATPGRLLDHLRRPYARLHHVEVLVLDEADRMLDMGFLPDVRRVLQQLPKRLQQTLLFSATLPPAVVALSREMMATPVRIGVEREAKPAHGITQAVYPVPASLKPELLTLLLQKGDVGTAIVFCRTKHRADRLAEKLVRRGVAATRIHGNRSQSQRASALQGFKAGRFRVLVATDIAARGIDVDALEHVVNFDVPNEADDYIHRIGRTARAGASGEAYTLVSPDEEPRLRDIERALRGEIERRTVPGFDYAARTEVRPNVGAPLGEGSRRRFTSTRRSRVYPVRS
jgi:ATP-dependent RNA helicase RhlE